MEDPSRLKEILNQTAQWAVEELQRRGHRIRSEVSFGIDPKLKFMGYTTKVGNGQRIIVSGWSLSTPMVKGLLIHELSHVILTDENHPAHQFDLLSAIVNKYSNLNNLDDRTAETLNESLTHVQDIYADDIGFTIFKDELSLDMLVDFFANWVSDGIPDLYGRDRSGVLSTLASNAFGLASLKRRSLLNHNAELEIKRKNSKFLKAAFPNSSFERTTLLYGKLADFLATLSKFTEEERGPFSKQMNQYFDLILSTQAFD